MSRQRTGATCWRSQSINKRQHARDPSVRKDTESQPHNTNGFTTGRREKSRSDPALLLFPKNAELGAKMWFIRKLNLLYGTKLWPFICCLLNLIRRCGFLCFQTSVQETVLFSSRSARTWLSQTATAQRLIICRGNHPFLWEKGGFFVTLSHTFLRSWSASHKKWQPEGVGLRLAER